MSAKVTQLFSLTTLELRDTEVILNLLSDHLMKSSKTVKYISEQTGLCKSTISNIMSRETRFPRTTTVIVLLQYFGYKIYLKKV